LLTVWDGGGDDTYDMSNYSNGVTADLRPGEWSTMSSVQLASLAPGHIARGNVANALMYQGNTASLIENAKGGAGNDTFIANQVANHLTGNAGADTFKWMAGTDAGTGALADTIMDFASGTDKISLSFDANPGTSAVDAFHFIGTAAFTHAAGELRYDVIGGSAHVFADLDGNGVADIEIVVNNVSVLSGSDFIGGAGIGATASANPADNVDIDEAFVPDPSNPPDSDPNAMIGRAFNDFGGLADAQVHLGSLHNHASLNGLDFYF
jgi:Ca2+-binding RTX toxin-like protein